LLTSEGVPGIEHKISKLREKNEPVNAKNSAIARNFDPK
jgi:hypothetical protein